MISGCSENAIAAEFLISTNHEIYLGGDACIKRIVPQFHWLTRPLSTNRKSDIINILPAPVKVPV